MTDDKPGGNANDRPAAGRSRSRREPVTLEQKPLSVTVEPAEPAAGTVKAEPEQEAGAPPADTVTGSAGPFEAAAAADAAPHDTPRQEELPPLEEQRAVADEPAAAIEEEISEKPPAPVAPGRSGGLVVALLAGGIAGAAVSAGLPFLLNADRAGEQRLAALEQSAAAAASRTDVQAAARAAEEAGSLNTAVAQRVAALEERVAQLAQGLEAAPEPGSAEPRIAAPDAALDELRAEIGGIRETLAASGGEIAEVGRRVAAFAGQVGGVEEAIATLDPARVREVLEERAGLNRRLAGLEETVSDKLGQIDLARLAAAADTQAGEIARLATRVTAAEGAVTETERRAQAVSAATGERVVVVARLAVLERLGAALARGQAFPAEIDTLSRLGVDATSLAALHGAAGGLATAASLAVPFTNSAAAFEMEDLPADAGIVDRLAASASRIVRIRPVDGEPDPSDVAGQVETFLRRGEAETALAAWRRLPEKARAQTGALAETLQKRVDAEAALAALTQAQVRALEALPAAAGQGG